MKGDERELGSRFALAIGQRAGVSRNWATSEVPWQSDGSHCNGARSGFSARLPQSAHSRWLVLLALGVMLISDFPLAKARTEDRDDYLTRETGKSLIEPEHKSRY